MGFFGPACAFDELFRACRGLKRLILEAMWECRSTVSVNLILEAPACILLLMSVIAS